MRAERLRFLKDLNALKAPAPAAAAEPIQFGHGKPKPPVREDAVKPEDMIKYRLEYVKAGVIRLQGHSDMLRILPRVFRRAKLPLGYSWGFRPGPILSFSPATPLGTFSVAEAVDVALTDAIGADEVLERVNAVADPGLHFRTVRVLAAGEKNAGAAIDSTDYLVALPALTPELIADAARKAMTAEELPVPIVRKKGRKLLDARPGLELARYTVDTQWPADLLGPAPQAPLLHIRLRQDIPTPRPVELVTTMFGDEVEIGPIVRLSFQRRQPKATQSLTPVSDFTPATQTAAT